MEHIKQDIEKWLKNSKPSFEAVSIVVNSLVRINELQPEIIELREQIDALEKGKVLVVNFHARICIDRALDKWKKALKSVVDESLSCLSVIEHYINGLYE